MVGRIATLSLLIMGICFISACKRTQYPNGFPKIAPCQVKVVDGGTPVEGVSVKLETSDDAINKWGCAGMTNAEGVATMRCRGYDGAPAGTFKVLLEKKDPPIKEVAPEKFEPGNTENQLDPVYADLEQTPFFFEMGKKQKTVPVFDLADGSIK